MKSKYLIIYNEYCNKIDKGHIKVNTKLPSENELMGIYGVSRDTIRKALNLLAQNGYIQKVRGKGSFVLDVSKYDFPVSGLISFKELSEKMGIENATYIEELQEITPDKYIKEQLDLDQEDKVWKIVRVREMLNEKIILDKDYYNSEVIPPLTEEICKDSIYEYLEREGIEISFARKEITVEPPTKEDEELLDLENFNLIVVVKNYVFLKDARLFQYTESRHRPDKFRFVDFARRKNTQ